MEKYNNLMDATKSVKTILSNGNFKDNYSLIKKYGNNTLIVENLTKNKKEIFLISEHSQCYIIDKLIILEGIATAEELEEQRARGSKNE